MSGPTLGHIVRQKEVNRTQCLLPGRSRSGGETYRERTMRVTVMEEAAERTVGAWREGAELLPTLPPSPIPQQSVLHL